MARGAIKDMKRLSALAALVLTSGLSLAAPASARDAYVLDQASMFSAGTASALNSRIANFNAQTHKEIVIQTVAALNGATVKDAGEKAFAQQQVNGILIFIAKDDRRDIIIPDTAGVQAGWFTPETLRTIRQSMESDFKNGDFDTGITSAVSSILGIYRSHLSSMPGAANSVPAGQGRAYSNSSSTGGFRLSGFWLIVLLVAAFLVLRSLIRAMTAPRPMYPPGAVPPGAQGYGAPGYGPGYGGGGGGSFFSGLLGGLGGAFLGNELFGNRGGGSAGGWGGSDVSGGAAGGGAAPDAGGWGSDAGQADMGGSSSGDWSGGGFGDSGGGGDFGGGGGDSGGGW